MPINTPCTFIEARARFIRAKNIKHKFVVCRVLLLLALLTIGCPQLLRAADNPAAVQYSVSIPDPSKHIFHISMEIKKPSSVNVELKMPIWMQAVYELQTYGEQVQAIKAHNEAGAAIELTSVNDHTWRLKLNQLEPVIIEYDLDVGDKHKLFGKSYLEKQTALLHGGSSLLYVQTERRKPVSINFKLPAGWSSAAALDGEAHATTAAAATTTNAITYTARDYDELTDSPIMLGSFKRTDFNVAGIPFSVAIDTRIHHSNAEIIESAQKIAAREISFFGGAPFNRYLFIYYLTKDTSGAGLPASMVGIEHLKSTLITVDPNFDTSPRSTFAYREVTAHELFHAWNVKAIRPAALDYPDFDKAPVVRSLWLLEGFTEYYAQKFLAQLFGDEKHEQFYKQINEDLFAAELPVSLQQLSLQSPTESIDDFSLLYSKGTAAGLLLDLKMRQLTKNARGLDDFMRTLWTRYGKARAAYDENALLKLLNDTAQNDLTHFYRKYIVGVSPLPLNDYLQLGGWTLKGQKIKSPFMDFTVAKNVVMDVAASGNAELSGIQLGDKIIAVDGTMLDEQNTFGKLVAKRGVGAKHTFTIERDGGKREEIPFKYETTFIRNPTIAELPDATPEQLATRRAVLSQTNAAPAPAQSNGSN